jgi:hypothetical protein
MGLVEQNWSAVDETELARRNLSMVDPLAATSMDGKRGWQESTDDMAAISGFDDWDQQLQ